MKYAKLDKGGKITEIVEAETAPAEDYVPVADTAQIGDQMPSGDGRQDELIRQKPSQARS